MYIDINFRTDVRTRPVKYSIITVAMLCLIVYFLDGGYAKRL
jgi:hypothetical protein